MNRGMQLLGERFRRDSVMALATVENGAPSVRNVNAYYENGAFYVAAHALSGKMRQLAANPPARWRGEWFTAHRQEKASAGSERERPWPQKRAAFAEWIDNGHNDLSDSNCVILRIRLTDAVLFANGTRYELDFAEKGKE